MTVLAVTKRSATVDHTLLGSVLGLSTTQARADWDGAGLRFNHHRVTVERGIDILHDEVIEDSPMHTAIRHAVTTLAADNPVPDLQLAPLRRIAALAELLRAQQPRAARISTPA